MELFLKLSVSLPASLEQTSEFCNTGKELSGASHHLPNAGNEAYDRAAYLDMP